MVSKVLLRAALAGALLCGLAVPASANSAVYCNPGGGTAGLDGVTGSVSYTPAVLSPTVPTLTKWTLDVNLRCTAGLPQAAGTYHLIITGTSSETCANGGGGGTVTPNSSAKTSGVGSGPVVNGAWQYARYGLHYYGFPGSGDGDIYVQEATGAFHHYKVYMWLDLLPTVANGACPGLGGSITGHALITEP